MPNNQLTYDILQDWIKILSITELNRDDCELIMSKHPLALALTCKPFQDAISGGFKYSFGSMYVPQEAKERFEKEASKANDWVIDTFRLACGYGMGAIAMVVKGSDPSKPIDTKWISEQMEAGFNFNSLEPRILGGSAMTNLDPNSTEFLRAIDFKVYGKQYHFSRCLIVRNPFESPDNLRYNNSSYGFHAASIFQRSLPELKQYLRVKISEGFMTSKVGTIIVKQEQSSSVYDKFAEAIASFKRAKVESIVSGQALIIGKNDELGAINLEGVSNTMSYFSNSCLNGLAISTRQPSSYLKGELLSTGMSDGTHDKEIIDAFKCTIQEIMRPVYEWIDDKLFYAVWNYDFVEQIAKLDPETYSGKTYNQIINLWKDNYKRIFNPPTAESPQDKAVANKLKIEIVDSVTELLQRLADKPQLAELAVREINTLEIFSSQIEVDFEAINDEQQNKNIQANDVDLRWKNL